MQQSIKKGTWFREFKLHICIQKLSWCLVTHLSAFSVVLQDNDFKLLRPGDPTFLTFSGETVKHEGQELYPFFINECAYYEKKIAFHLAKKITLNFPSVSVKKDWERRQNEPNVIALESFELWRTLFVLIMF